ncbi:hypothetical protein CVT24_000206 [Panaeolus cyanescens]|uniref:Uncharacterized protein n=1 Tax=Panaeolus cyanescens TaxID=181874 RepID=A0A409VIJ3_9AGAR|nr:hypothetical protein CVT24_000206 [Panaeolus cyanescens]
MVMPATIEDFFFDLLSPREILRWSRINFQSHQAVKSYFRRNFKISRILGKFFKSSEIPLFRYLQHRTGMVISGSAALQFLDRADYGKDTDLDVYVELRFCERICDWLQEIGYGFVPVETLPGLEFADMLSQSLHSFHRIANHEMFYRSKKIHTYFGRGITKVFNFTRDGHKIQVITTESSPIEVILNFHSTCVMNFITYDKAYSLYPQATFEERRSLLTRDSRLGDSFTKYQGRGWTMIPRITSWAEREDPNAAFGASRRFVGDEKCWVLPIHPPLSISHTTQTTAIEANSWALAYDPRDNWKANMQSHNLASKHLKFRYTVADTEVASFINVFFRPLDDMTRKEPTTAEDYFFSLLSPATLLRYSRTSRTAYYAVKSYMRRSFKLSDVLSPYFTPQEILYFRYLQWKYNMLISGSTALQFFNRGASFKFNDGESDLDIYAELRFCERIGEWLTQIGYVFHQRTIRTPRTFGAALNATTPLYANTAQDLRFYESSERPYIGRGIANVFNFRRNGRKIQLIASDSVPLEIILNFHSTCVMNIITYSKAYSLYPLGTFEQKRSLLYSTQGTNQEAAIRKYAKRGWKMLRGITDEHERENPKAAFGQGRRFVGDGKCWTIRIEPAMPFGMDGVSGAMGLGMNMGMEMGMGMVASMSNPIEANSWELKYDDEDPDMKYRAQMAFYNLSGRIFKFKYMVADLDMVLHIDTFFGGRNRRIAGSEIDTWAREGYKDEELRMLIKWKLVNAVNPND